ncbi:MAG: hypothetical protein HY430_02520 [Candidatus Levybacteria bacterium]|nr:hypothetical protein [Candidatus Levybacteria bacterium]
MVDIRESSEYSRPENGLDLLAKATSSFITTHPDGTTTEITIDSDDDYIGKIRGAGGRVSKSRTDTLANGIERSLWVRDNNTGAAIVSHSLLSDDTYSRARFSYAPNVNGIDNPFVLQIQGISTTTPNTVFYARYSENGQIGNFSIEVSRSLRDARNRLSSELFQQTDEGEGVREEFDFEKTIDELVGMYITNPDLFKRALSGRASGGAQTEEKRKRGILFQRQDPQKLSASAADNILTPVLRKYEESLQEPELQDLKGILSSDLSSSLYHLFNDKELDALATGAVRGNINMEELLERTYTLFTVNIHILKRLYDAYIEKSSRYRLVFIPKQSEGFSQSSYHLQVQPLFEKEGGIEERDIFEEDASEFNHGLYTYGITKDSGVYRLTVQNRLQNEDARSIEFPEHFDAEAVINALTINHYNEWEKALELVRYSYDEPH